MIRSTCAGARALAAGLALLLASACADAPGPTTLILDGARPDIQASVTDPEAQPFTVYTQNVYLGGDTGPIFSLDFSNIPALLQATNSFWAQVKASDVPGRAAAMVDELEARRPHVVGFLEVFRFVVVDPRNGVVHDYVDLLAAIQAEIASRGLPYEVVRVQENTSSALPLAIDFSAGQISRALSFTDRVVALRRTDVEISSSAQGTYAARVALGPGVLKRGWVRLSVEHEGTPYHFVTTHLETQGLAPVQAGQVAELLGSVLAGLDGVTVLAGDLNSDAAALPGEPSWTPTYGTLLEAGFVDAWTESGGRPIAGFTCCQDPDLRNGLSTLDERIDFVMLRASRDPSAADRTPGSIRVEIVGEEPDDRTASGLWRADHAGLVAGLRLPRGLNAIVSR